MLDAVGQLPPQHLANAGLHIVDRQVLDPLAPHRDALEQRARHVGPWLPDRQHGVEVDVRLDERRSHQPPGHVDRLARVLLDRHEQTVAHAEVGESGRTANLCVAHQEIKHAPNLCQNRAGVARDR